MPSCAVGAASVTFAAGMNSRAAARVGRPLRGRVMALYSVVFLGSTPIGAPIVGALSEATSPRTGMAIGGAAALLTALGAARAFRRAAATAAEPSSVAFAVRPPASTALSTTAIVTPRGRWRAASTLR